MSTNKFERMRRNNSSFKQITNLATRKTEKPFFANKDKNQHFILNGCISGESLLHILIICDTLVHTRIARLLLQIYPRCAVDKIEGEEYLGKNLLLIFFAELRGLGLSAKRECQFDSLSEGQNSYSYHMNTGRKGVKVVKTVNFGTLVLTFRHYRFGART